MTADYYKEISIYIHYKDGTQICKELEINKCYVGNESLEIKDNETDNIIQLIIDKKNNETEECIFKDGKWRCDISTIKLIKNMIKDMSLIDEIRLDRYYYV